MYKVMFCMCQGKKFRWSCSFFKMIAGYTKNNKKTLEDINVMFRYEQL